jgi:predicted PurR-regulated permease PerM
VSTPLHPPPPTAAAAPWAGGWVGKGLLAIATLFLLKAAEPVLVPMAVAIVVTFVLAQPLRVLHRYGVPRMAGAALLVVALIGSLVLMAGSLVGPAAKWWERAPSTGEQLIEQWERVRANLPLLRREVAPLAAAPAPASGAGRRRASAAAGAGPQPLAETAARATPPDALGSTIAAEGIALARLVLAHFMSFGVAAVATVMLLYFLLASEHWIVSRAVEALPQRRSRARVLSAVRRAERDIGHFLGTLAIINGGVGIATGLATWMLGLENPILWGTLAAALCFIPYLGPAITVGLLLLAGMLSFADVSDMVAPPLAFLAIHFVETNLVSPWFIGRRLALSPVVVFASVMWMGWLWGVAGAMLTVPLLIGLRCVLASVRSLRPWCVMLEGRSDGVPTLSSLLRRRRPAAAGAGAQRLAD